MQVYAGSVRVVREADPYGGQGQSLLFYREKL